jgi:hypothetical protein
MQPPVMESDAQAPMLGEIMNRDDHRAESRGGSNAERPSRAERIRDPIAIIDVSNPN